MHDTLICNALEHFPLDDGLKIDIEDQLRRMFAIDAERPLDINSLQLS